MAFLCPQAGQLQSIWHSACYSQGDSRVALYSLVYVSGNPGCKMFTSEASPPALGKCSLTPKLINLSPKNGVRFSCSHTYCTLYFIFILLEYMYCICIKQAMPEASFQKRI